MNSTVAIAMFGWVPVACALFWFMPARRAALVGMLAAWLILPIAAYRIPGWPDYTKTSATCGVLILAATVFDFRRVVSFRPAWIDGPIVLWCLFPFISSVVNGLGVHDGFSAVFDQAITWGAPYAIGRLYFDDLDALRELAIGIFTGGVVYTPFCLFEIWNGPILHRALYGYLQPYLDGQLRFGILRPMVFMDSALMLAVWMAGASVLGLWLWKSRAGWFRGRTLPGWLVPLPVIATVLMRAVNGWALLTLGVLLFVLSLASRSRLWLLLVLTLIPVYLGVRASGLWSGQQLAATATLIHPSRGWSMSFRLQNEDLLVSNLRGHGLFGHGRQPAALTDSQGTYIIPDSLWIITLTYFGAFGLITWIASLILPVLAFASTMPARRWFDADVGPAAGLAVVLLLSTIDYLVNAMINPVFMMIAGGLPGLWLTMHPRDLRETGSPADRSCQARSRQLERDGNVPPLPALADLPKIHLSGAWLHAITEQDCVNTVFRELDHGRGGFIHTMNLDHLRRFVREPDYAACCRSADIRTADGMPLVWASRLQGTPLPERVPGSSLIWSLSEAAAKRGRSVFLLGGAPGSAPKAATILCERYRGLRVAGLCTPTFGPEVDERERSHVRRLVISAQPDIVYVALGSPKQEELIEEMRGSLPACWWIGVGIAFSFVAGDIPRAPRWMQRVCLEWVHRLRHEPRLARRYVVDGIPFALALLGSSLEARKFSRRT